MNDVATATFLDAVVPEGNRYIGYTDGTLSQKSDREIIKCSVFVAAEKGESRGFWLDKKEDVKNVYFALASFKQAKIYDEKGGYEKSHRHQSNVAQLKSLWLDVDFKQYSSPEACVQDIVRWIEEVRVPEPTFIVNSGGGIHLYWCFEQPVSPETWQPMAQGLAAIAKRGGLRADYGVTIDSARVLRLPGTHNRKYDGGPICRITKMGAFANLDRMKELLEPHAAGAPGNTQQTIDFTIDPKVIQMMPASSDDLSANYTSGRKSYVSEARKQCGTLDEAIRTGGASHSYGYWKDVLHVLAFMEDGEEYIHKVSDKHKGYKEDVTVERYEESVTTRITQSRGPTTCERFSHHRPACLSCPHWGKVKSPWNLGYQAAETPSNQNDPTYASGGQTYYWMTEVDEDGNPSTEKVVIADSELTGFHLVLGIEDEMELRFTATNGKWRRQLALTPSVIGDTKQLIVALMKGGCAVSEARLRLCKGKLMSWMERLQKEKEASNIDSAGWTRDKKAFVLGGRGVTQGDDLDIVRDRTYAEIYEPHGEMEVWQAVANHMCNDVRPEFSFLLATSFAGPLMRFGKPNSCVISVTSNDSGVGKSTVLRCAQAAWGDPTQMMFMNDTSNSIVEIAAKSRDLPLYWDEVRGQENTDELTETVFRLNQGRSKRRLNSKAEIQKAPPVNVMLVCATNNPIADHINKRITTSDAGAMRLLEFNMERDGRGVDHAFNAMEAQLDHNYGHAGPVYLRYVMANMDKVEKLLGAVRDALCARHNFTQEKRFWLNSLTKICAAAVLMKGSGIVDINPNRVLDFAIRVADTQDLAIAQHKDEVSNVVVDMVVRNVEKLMITDTMPRKPGPQNIVVRRAPLHNAGPRIQIDLERLEIYVAGDIIRDYADSWHGGNATAVRSLLKKQFLAEQVKRSLGAGTAQASPQTTVYKMAVADTVGEDMVSKWVSASSAPQPAPMETS